ncbi:unnamed protein product, partial [Polarella glacialis]
EDAGEAESEAPKPKLKRAQTTNLGFVGKPTQRPAADYRTHEGLQALKKPMGVEQDASSKRSSARAKAAAEAAATDAMEAPKVPPAPPRSLADGHSYGEKVVSLISRTSPGNKLMIESGQEGTLVGAVKKSSDLWLLVQFQRGTDWWLAPSQLSAPPSFGSVRAAGLSGFTWGCRVKCLVTYLCPPGSSLQQDVWLGGEGIVIGPSAVKGKIAVCFDDGTEWSIWPALLCKSEDYDKVVTQKFGKLGRGDRVRSKGKLCGARSYSPEVAESLAEGSDGTVVGPGHSPGAVLVHFDSDDKVWSVKPSQLASTSTCI